MFLEKLCYTSTKEAYKKIVAESLTLRLFFLVMNFTLIAKETVPHKAKYSLAPVTVYIRDVNDNFPDFTQPFYEVRFCTYTNSVLEYCAYGECGILHVHCAFSY